MLGKTVSFNLRPFGPKSLSGDEVRQLVRHHQTSNTGRRKSGQDTRGKRGQGQFRDVTAARGSKLAENTDLDTKRTNVAEAAQRVGGNELGTGGEVGVFGVGSKGTESIVLVLDNLLVTVAKTHVIQLTVMIFSAISLETF